MMCANTDTRAATATGAMSRASGLILAMQHRERLRNDASQRATSSHAACGQVAGTGGTLYESAGCVAKRSYGRSRRHLRGRREEHEAASQLLAALVALPVDAPRGSAPVPSGTELPGCQHDLKRDHRLDVQACEACLRLGGHVGLVPVLIFPVLIGHVQDLRDVPRHVGVAVRLLGINSRSAIALAKIPSHKSTPQKLEMILSYRELPGRAEFLDQVPRR